VACPWIRQVCHFGPVAAFDQAQVHCVLQHLRYVGTVGLKSRWRWQFSTNDFLRVAAFDALAREHPVGDWRVRLLCDRFGAVRVEAFALEGPASPVRVQLAATPLMDSDSEFVRHKTTRRAHYEAFAPRSSAVFDTLLWNERGELTEFTRGNVALYIDGEWLTPTLRCGLLPGIARARLLDEGRIREAVLMRSDLGRATGLAFFNSLRGWLDASLVDAES